MRPWPERGRGTRHRAARIGRHGPPTPSPSKPGTPARPRAARPGGPELDRRLAEAERHCQSHGLRLTTGREAVLRALLQRGGTAKAYELLADLQSGGSAVAPMAVYRALDFLVEHDLVHKVASKIGRAHV